MDPDGAGALVSGFDEDFKEPVLVDTDNDGVSDFVRSEHDAVFAPCQVEPVANEVLQMSDAGNTPQTVIDLVFHMKDLERMGLVNTDGTPLIQNSDRLVSIRDRKGVVVQHFKNPPGLFVVESRPLGFGLGLHHSCRNLLFVKFRDRSPRGF
jgi:hypothetical protein